MDVLRDLLDGASEMLRSVRLDVELPVAVVEKLVQLPNLCHLRAPLPGTHIPPL